LPLFCHIWNQIAPHEGVTTLLSVGQQSSRKFWFLDSPPAPLQGLRPEVQPTQVFFVDTRPKITKPLLYHAGEVFFMGNRLAGRRAIVTGAASGIGLATVKLFLAQGASVLGVDLPGERLDAALAETGASVLGVSVTDSDAPDKIVAAATQAMGGIDILFNNAGVVHNCLLDRMSDDDWDGVIDVNLRSIFRITRACAPALKQSGAGRIINTASVMAEATGMGMAAYSASKAAVLGLTMNMAVEFGKSGCTANAILPGAIWTGMTSAMWEERPEVADAWAAKTALRRLGQPEDIARVALFLASDDGGYVSGQGLTVDGGLTAKLGG
jgi:3-oxoacyl-[acyl-carrier protein] reductase